MPRGIHSRVGDILRRRLRQARFESPVHEAVLGLLAAASDVRARHERVLERHAITPGQFNVLRILRGARAEGYPRCEIARRLVDRSPDVTRLIDRLERQGLVERARSDADRRLSVTRVTRRGLELLERVGPDVEAANREIAARLGAGDARELTRLCEALMDHEPEEDAR